MGVAGAGLATAITAALNPLLIVLVSLRERNILIAPWKKLLDLGGFLGLYWRRVLPVLCNELLWSLSIVLLNMILGRMGTENYAALTVVRTVENVVYVFFVGVCSACNVLIGKRIGEGDEAAARLYARRFLVLIPLLGAAFGLLVAALRVPVLSLFDMSDAARAMAMGMMLVYAVDVGIRNVPYLCVVGIFRAGGGHALRAHRRRGGQLRPRAAGGAAVQQHPGLFVPADVHHHARGGRRGQARVLPAAHLLHEVDSPRGGPARGGAAAGGRVTPPAPPFDPPPLRRVRALICSPAGGESACCGAPLRPPRPRLRAGAFLRKLRAEPLVPRPRPRLRAGAFPPGADVVCCKKGGRDAA